MATKQRLVQRQLGGTVARRPRVCLYVDESKTARWVYIGVLALRDDEDDALLSALDEDRNAIGYQRELHFARITRRSKADLAARWLSRAIGVNSPPVRFHILAIDQHTLNLTAFGTRRRDQAQNVYRRFLRSALAYPLKAFFGSDAIIKAIVHDDRNVAADEYFEWHTPWRMREMAGIEVATDAVQFIDSDHLRSGRRESHLVQLIDTIVGASRVCMEVTTSKPYQRQLALGWLPLVEHLTDRRRRWDRRSPYGHVGRCNLSFFPKYQLTLDELDDNAERARSSFYFARAPALRDPSAGEQPALWT